MLPVLLKLLHMPTVLEQVPQVLTDLLQRSPAMQKAANDSDAVTSLTTILHHEHTWHNRPRFKASMAGSATLFPHVFSSSVCLQYQQPQQLRHPHESYPASSLEESLLFWHINTNATWEG